jgi:hypothetical protein
MISEGKISWLSQLLIITDIRMERQQQNSGRDEWTVDLAGEFQNQSRKEQQSFRERLQVAKEFVNEYTKNHRAFIDAVLGDNLKTDKTHSLADFWLPSTYRMSNVILKNTSR